MWANLRAREAVAAKTLSRVGVIELPVLRLHVELTNQCNFSCEFCPDRSMRRPRGSMPLSMVERLLADNRKAKELLGWGPQISLGDGLRATIAWISQHLSRYRPDVYEI